VAKLKLALKVRRFDDIVMNKEQSKTALAELRQRISANSSNKEATPEQVA
jgi:hypothetical protein